MRPLEPERDTGDVIALWERTLGDRWPVRGAQLRAVLHAGYCVEVDGRIAGAVAIDPQGSLPFLIVEPELQRRGIGSALNEAAIGHLGGLGLETARLGAGGSAYLWPGVPRDLPGADGFFFRRSWAPDGLAGDLLLDLVRFRPARETADRAASAGIGFALAAAADAADILAYEEREHPGWTRFFRRHLDEDPGTILIGRDRGGVVVAALLMEIPPRSGPAWSRMLGDDVAEIGCVGVAAARNGEGIGAALMSVASAHVLEKGARAAYVGYVVRFTFYERLGYRLWREYRMASRTL